VFGRKRLSRLARGQPSHRKDVGLFQGILNAFHVQFRKKVDNDVKKKAS
jgi:hypothetical protein